VSLLTGLGAVGLTAIAAVAVLWPFQRRSAAALRRLADPLEDERRRALRQLRDLDEDRAAGKLDETGYREARAEAEAGAVAVLRALEARDGTASWRRACARSAGPPRQARAARPAGRGQGGAGHAGRGPRSPAWPRWGRWSRCCPARPASAAPAS